MNLLLLIIVNFFNYLNFTTPEISKKWRLDVLTSSYYYQYELNDSLYNFKSGYAELRWKVNSLARISLGTSVIYRDDIENYIDYGIQLAGHGGAFCDIGILYFKKFDSKLFAFQFDFQKNNFSGITFSPGYCWEDSKKSFTINTDFYMYNDFAKTTLSFSKIFDNDILSYNSSSIQFANIISLPYNFKCELQTEVLLGEKDYNKNSDWSFSLSLLIPIIRDPSSVRGFGSISGIVTDNNNNYLNLVKIISYGEDTIYSESDIEGIFCLEHIASGIISLNAEKEGYQSRILPVPVKKNEICSTEIIMIPDSEKNEIIVSTFSTIENSPLSVTIMGTDISDNEFFLEVSDSEVIVFEKDGYVPIKFISGENKNVHLYFLPEEYEVNFIEKDFNDSTFSSSGMMKLLPLINCLNYYPNIKYILTGEENLIKIVQNFLFSFSNKVITEISTESNKILINDIIFNLRISNNEQ